MQRQGKFRTAGFLPATCEVPPIINSPIEDPLCIEIRLHQSDSTAALIAQLSRPAPGEREQAGRELFRRGCALAEPVLRSWFANPAFRALARAGGPLLTVGIAVTPVRFEEIRAACGQPTLAEVPPNQDAREFEIEFAHGVRLDILTPRDPSGDGALARFLARFGEGIQQVECDVRDAGRATEILREQFALEPVYTEACTGAGHTRVNFFLVPLPEGEKVLIELVELPARKSRK
jgi:hypothetical protein